MVDILPPETEKDKPQTNGRGKPEALAPDLDVAVNFLKRLHPGAPWETLTAIVPDGTPQIGALLYRPKMLTGTFITRPTARKRQ